MYAANEIMTIDSESTRQFLHTLTVMAETEDDLTVPELYAFIQDMPHVKDAFLILTLEDLWM